MTRRYVSGFMLLCISAIAAITSSHKSEAFCFPCISFKERSYTIAQSKHFYACMDPRDTRVPRVFLQTHEHIQSLAEWTPEMWYEFGKFERCLENALRNAFDAELVNVACLMNLAGGEGPHTHWHFIPRFPHTITITSQETNETHILQDPCYGKAYDMNGKNYRAGSPAIMDQIVKEIQKHLDISELPEGEFAQ